MRYERYNSEGYKDLTAYQAFRNIEKQRKKELKPTKDLLSRYGGSRHLVYICSPYAGDTEINIFNARRYCAFAVTKQVIPIAPHLLFPQFMDDREPKQREKAMFMNIILLQKCKELWVFGSTMTTGMKQEILNAKQRNMRIRYWNSECQEVPYHA